MTQNNSQGFAKVQAMVRGHLADAEKYAKPTEGHAPTPAQCYTAAFHTATGAYGGGAINVNEWSDLHGEIREHQDIWSSK